MEQRDEKDSDSTNVVIIADAEIGEVKYNDPPNATNESNNSITEIKNSEKSVATNEDILKNNSREVSEVKNTDQPDATKESKNNITEINNTERPVATDEDILKNNSSEAKNTVQPDATNELNNDNTENKNIERNVATDEDVSNNNSIEVKLGKEMVVSICGWGDCTEICDMKCGACQKVTYCCSAHQKKHWKEHRKDCCPYVIKQSEEFGSYMVAARDLKANAEIIRESPAVYAPVYREVSPDGPNGDPAPNISFCLACCNHISDDKVCSKCSWPICGNSCENNVCHSEYECEYMSKGVSYKDTIADKNMFDVYKSVFALRCLIFRKKNPNTWGNVEKAFIAKEDESERSDDDKETCNKAEILIALITYYGAESLMQDSHDLNRILDIICYLSVGDTRTVPHENGSYVRSAIFIFEKLLMLGSNNCYPNSSWGISFPPAFEIVIRSAVPIKKGEMISIPLNNEYDLYATYLRQLHRLKGRRRPCKCVRCSDPTELQTNLASVKCFLCKKGYFTPVKPLLINSDWRCCYCEVVVQCTKIFDVIRTAEVTIHEAMDESNIEDLENIYNRLMKQTFHPHHFMVVNLSYHILQMHMQNVFNLNDFGLERVVAHCRNILAVADVILPGLSMIRATILTFQTKAMCLQIRNSTSNSKVFTPTKKNLLTNQLTKLRQCLSDALEYYKTDPNSTLPSGENCFVEELEIIESQIFRTNNELQVRKT